MSLIPELERSPEEGNGYPFQYSWLGNPVNRGAWWATVHGFAESDTTEWLNNNSVGQQFLSSPSFRLEVTNPKPTQYCKAIILWLKKKSGKREVTIHYTFSLFFVAIIGNMYFHVIFRIIFSSDKTPLHKKYKWSTEFIYYILESWHLHWRYKSNNKFTNASAWIKTVALNCTTSQILHIHALAHTKASFTEKVLNKAVKMINFINSCHMARHLFNILCDKTGSTHEALLLHTEF